MVLLFFTLGEEDWEGVGVDGCLLLLPTIVYVLSSLFMY